MHSARLGDRQRASTVEFARQGAGPHDAEAGTVTAEFAVLLPTVLAVLGLIIGGLFLASHRVGLVASAADIARLEARGDDTGAQARIARLPGGVDIKRERAGALLCVELRSRPGAGPLAVIELAVSSCAAVSEAAAP